MELLLNKERAKDALDELQSPKYDKYFKDDAWQKTRGHLSNVMRLYIDEGAEGLDRVYRRQKTYAQGLGSSSLMLGFFLLSLRGDPMLNKVGQRVHAELAKQWNEVPWYNGIMFGFSLLGLIRKLRLNSTDADRIAEAENLLRVFCENGTADRGLTCFWILLRGYVKDKVQ